MSAFQLFSTLCLGTQHLGEKTVYSEWTVHGMRPVILSMTHKFGRIEPKLDVGKSGEPAPHDLPICRMIAIPTMYSISRIIVYVKSENVIHEEPLNKEWKRNFVAHHSWAQEFFESSVGSDCLATVGNGMLRGYRGGRERFTEKTTRSGSGMHPRSGEKGRVLELNGTLVNSHLQVPGAQPSRISNPAVPL